MSTYEAHRPVYRVRCDGDGCTAEHEPASAFSARFAHGASLAAGEAGWDVPPPRGRGSRRGTHYCPACRALREAPDQA